jgi:hypothetical protein
VVGLRQLPSVGHGPFDEIPKVPWNRSSREGSHPGDGDTVVHHFFGARRQRAEIELHFGNLELPRGFSHEIAHTVHHTTGKVHRLTGNEWRKGEINEERRHIRDIREVTPLKPIREAKVLAGARR